MQREKWNLGWNEEEEKRERRREERDGRDPPEASPRYNLSRVTSGASRRHQSRQFLRQIMARLSSSRFIPSV